MNIVILSFFLPGMQDRWRPEIHEEAEWKTDHIIAKGYMPKA